MLNKKRCQHYYKLLDYVRHNKHLATNNHHLKIAIKSYLKRSLNQLDIMKHEISPEAWILFVHKLYPHEFSDYIRDIELNNTVQNKKYLRKFLTNISLEVYPFVNDIKGFCIKGFYDVWKKNYKNWTHSATLTTTTKFMWYVHMQSHQDYVNHSNIVYGTLLSNRMTSNRMTSNRMTSNKIPNNKLRMSKSYTSLS